MKPSVYLETSIISYLTARPSRDVMVAGMQEGTRRWWTSRRGDFDLVVAEIVKQEASMGDPNAAHRRAELLRDIPTVPSSEEAFAGILMAESKLPAKAALDAAHIAIATVNHVDLSAHVELPAHRQRCFPPAHRIDLSSTRTPIPADLHAR